MGPSQEERIKKLKKNKLGLIFLLSAVGCYTLGIFGSIVSCITVIMNLAALGLGITAIIFLIMGASSYRSPHKIFVISSISLVGVAIIFRIFISIMMAFSMFSSLMSLSTESTTGSELAEMLQNMKPFILLLIVPHLMISAALVLPVLKITPNWGKILAGAFGGMMVLGVGVMALVQLDNLNSLIDDIDTTDEYDPGEVQEFQNERVVMTWLSQLLIGLIHLLALGSIVGALLENNKKLTEAQRESERGTRGIYSLNGPLV
ncbi:MAG: hypothetical protein R6V01_04780 [Thermoplasmatota archaeon]